MRRPSLVPRLLLAGAAWSTYGLLVTTSPTVTGGPAVTLRFVPPPPAATMPATAPAEPKVPVATPRPLPAPSRGTVAPDRRPRPWCFLGTLPTCGGAAPMWSCPDSTVWPDPAIPCHVPWGDRRP